MKRLVGWAGLVAAFVLLLPTTVAAQGLVPCNGPECQFCHLVELVDNILDFFIIIAASFGAIMFAVAGLKMATAAGNETKVTEAKGSMTNVVIGFIILLAAWLIVDTVMKALATDQTYGMWNEIQCVQLPTYVREDPGNTTVYGSVGGDENTGGIVTGDSDEYTHAAATAMLTGAGIQVYSSGSCSDGSRSNCTSLDGVNQATIGQVLAIHEACGGCVTHVTGGTEVGHATGGVCTHASGCKIDLEDSQALNTFLESRLNEDGVRTGAYGGQRYTDSCGNEYVRESTHWDISITNGVCAL